MLWRAASEERVSPKEMAFLPSTIRPLEPNYASGIGVDASAIGGEQFRRIKKESKLANHIMVAQDDLKIVDEVGDIDRPGLGTANAG